MDKTADADTLANQCPKCCGAGSIIYLGAPSIVCIDCGGSGRVQTRGVTNGTMAYPASAAWQSIDSAPREPFELDVTVDDRRLPYRRMRMGPVIKIRGTHEGDVEEFTAVWTVLDDAEGYWFAEYEPVDWPITEWRPLTEAEEAECLE